MTADTSVARAAAIEYARSRRPFRSNDTHGLRPLTVAAHIDSQPLPPGSHAAIRPLQSA